MPTAQRPCITMSKESSSSKMPSNEELEKFTKIELIAFLKNRGVGDTGNRKQLVSLAKLYVNRPEIISDPEITFKPDSSLPNDSVIKWENAVMNKPAIPPGFTLETISSYLSVVSTYLSVHNDNDPENEPVDVSDFLMNRDF